MPVPIVTFGIVVLRSSLRPVNNILIRRFKSGAMFPVVQRFFTSFGHVCFKFEDFTADPEKRVGPQSDEKAVNKGIDFFTEIVFFYGTLLGIAWWEFHKYAIKQRKLNQRIVDLETASAQLLEKLTDVADISSVTSSNFNTI